MTPKVNLKLGFERREITLVKLKYELFNKHNMKHQKTFPAFKGVRKKNEVNLIQNFLIGFLYQ